MAFRVILVVVVLFGTSRWARCQQPAKAEIIGKIDAAVTTRDEDLLGYTVTEQYRVFRNGDKSHTSAEMTVKTTYRKDAGKSFVILAQSGSELVLKEVLARVLDSERLMTQPANRRQVVLTSANYDMAIGEQAVIGERSCTVISIAPKRSSPYLFSGKVWVDTEDGSIVKLEGIASKRASMLTGPAEVSRQYAKINGLPMATHAAARTASWLLGQTVIDINYSGYQMTLRGSAGVSQTHDLTAGAGSVR